MKRLLIILPFLFIPLLFGQQFVVTISYIDSTKREIVKDLKLNEYKFTISDRLWVIVDPSGKWKLSDDYYSYYFDFDNGDRLSTIYDSKTSKCIGYVWEYTKYDHYYDYIDGFKYLQPAGELTWLDDGKDYNVIFTLLPKGSKGGFTLYVYKDEK